MKKAFSILAAVAAVLCVAACRQNVLPTVEGRVVDATIHSVTVETPEGESVVVSTLGTNPMLVPGVLPGDEVRIAYEEFPEWEAIRAVQLDILTPSAWYERLADGGWRKHPLDVGFSDGGRALGHASNLIVFDVNKDGLADILVSSAHKYGIFWWEQLKERDAAGEIQFRKHVIDDTWTQAHYLGWGDIDNDGVPELVTGKRFMAHNGGDPDEYGPLGIYYYDFTPGPNPVFKKYVISYDSDISVGLNVECVDIDGDGDLDLVTTGKYGGPVILENKLK